LKKVTQCAVLDEFGLFLVLADKVLLPLQSKRVFQPHFTFKVLFAYHLEALVPTATSGNTNVSQIPQKINAKDVHFFSIGVLQGRTLVIYMKKKGVRSLFLTFVFDR
jgi:RHO1 GDP-GTP exchange protein 1/2